MFDCLFNIQILGNKVLILNCLQKNIKFSNTYFSWTKIGILLFFYIVNILLSGIYLLAQKPVIWEYAAENDKVITKKKGIEQSPQVANSASLAVILRKNQAILHSQGYLEANFDFEVRDSSFMVFGHIGALYRWGKIGQGNVPDDWLAAAGIRLVNLVKKPLSPTEIWDIEEKILNYAENNGYPFAQVWLDSVQLGEGQLSARLMLKTGAFFTFDTLITEGGVKLSPLFLQNYLEIQRGTPFSRERLKRISTRLAELPFLMEKEKPQIKFTGHYATVLLNIVPKKASRWDFLVGILPSTQADGSQKFNLTFNGTGDFQNLLGSGERLYAKFENLRPQSPRADFRLNFPYLFSLPLGADAQFNLYKRDTLFIETRLDAGASWRLGGVNYVKFFWENYTNKNLIINKLQIIQTKRLPATLDVATNTFGLEYQRERLDYRFNPRQGFATILRGGAGLRQVRRNTEIIDLKDAQNPDFEFRTLYDTVSLRGYQFKIEAKFDYFLKYGTRSTLRCGLVSGAFFTSSPLASNEQFRVGGARLLRGFDEESLNATQFAVASIEPRLLIGRNAFLYAFADFAFVADITRVARGTDFPIGFGGGMSFETPAGIFAVSLAAGRQQGQAVDFRSVKTHFGFVSLF